MTVTTTHGDMDEALLEKRTGEVDNDNERTTWVEYCLMGCTGASHKTNVPDAPGHMCSRHVHRSVHVRLKKAVVAFGEAAKLGG